MPGNSIRNPPNAGGMSDSVKQRRFDIFEFFPLPQWRKEFQTLSVREFQDKAPIYHQGEECRQVSIICKGHVKLSRINEQGGEFTLAVLSKGELLGPSLSDPLIQEAKESSIAKGVVQLYQVRVDEFISLLSRHSTLARGIISILSGRQRFLERRLECLVFKDVPGRLTETLLELGKHFGEKCIHGLELDFRLTQQELADLVGTSRPVISTILNRLRKRGVLDYDRDFICVKQIENLENLFNE